MTNEEKILSLIEKMYTEFTGRFEGIESNMAAMELNMATMESNMATKDDISTVKQLLARIEQDQGSKIAALFDASEVQFDVNGRICDTLNRIERKLDKLSLRVANQEDSLRKAR